MIRNLLFYVYPRRAGRRWRNAAARIRAARDQFDGRRIVTIAVDRCCVDPGDVIAYLDDPAAEFRIVDNDPRLQETAHFLTALEMVESRNADECTTYAHAKGATHCDPRAASHLWCDAMAAANLEYPELIDCALRRANIVGAFRSVGLWSFAGYHNWHFAGTWWTFRHSAVFASGRDWRNLHESFEGVEAWPGILPYAESACLFYDNANTAHLYDLSFWRNNLTPSLRYWRKSLAAAGLDPTR
jgi:hypothetical protein